MRQRALRFPGSEQQFSSFFVFAMGSPLSPNNLSNQHILINLIKQKMSSDFCPGAKKDPGKTRV